MSLKIERVAGTQIVSLRLIGRLEWEHLAELKSQIHADQAKVVLDLDEVTLVDVSVVRFLIACEGAGVRMLNCPPYVREWMESEQRVVEG